MSKRILVVGLGRFGSSLAESLAGHGCEVIAVDRDMRHVDQIKQKVAYALELDATDPAALKSIDAPSCTAAVVAIGESFEAAVLAVAALREVGVHEIVARATTPRHARILQAAGARKVLELEAEMGRAFGRSLAADDVAATVAAQALGQGGR